MFSSLVAGIPSFIIPVIIILVSVVALTIIFERGWLLLRKTNTLNRDDQARLIDYLQAKKFDDAISFCRLQTHPAYKVAQAMIEAQGTRADLKNVAEEETLRQMTSLEKYLPSLGTISTVAPLLGLLGTVTGMIKSFKAFGESASRNAQLMGGIDEALITTALGLIVAIPALIMYNYYVRRVNLLGEESAVLQEVVATNLK